MSEIRGGGGHVGEDVAGRARLGVGRVGMGYDRGAAGRLAVVLCMKAHVVEDKKTKLTENRGPSGGGATKWLGRKKRVGMVSRISHATPNSMRLDTYLISPCPGSA